MTTPMMQQYRTAKERHPGTIVLFRNGDFYELFEEDAEVGARLLGITLTRRDKEIPMAGVPYHALDRYLGKLLQAGHRVAICEQMEDPRQVKGRPVRREVTRVVTPGTLTEDDLLDPRRANHLIVLTPPGGRTPAGLAWVELSTGLFQAADVPRERLSDEVLRLAPSECLCSEAMTDETGILLARVREALPRLIVTPRPDWTFDPRSACETLFRHFGVATLAGFGFEDNQPCLTAAGALLAYLQETLKASLAHLTRLRPYSEQRFLSLDEVTRRSLELTRTLRDNALGGSLLGVMDRTMTPMGARLLHDWILAPLAERAAIMARFDAVEELLGEHGPRRDLRESLADVFDLQRLTARISTGRASPRDLTAVKRTLALLPRIKTQMRDRESALLRDLEARLEVCPELREALESALVDDPPLSPREGGMIRREYDKELDELRDISTQGKDWIAQFQADAVRSTGITSLKVGFNNIFGYYIEITHANAARVPPDYKRVSTLKNAERYTTPELKEWEEKVLGAQEKIYQREYDLFMQLRERVAAQTNRLMQTAEVLATLDVLASLAELAAERNYSRPELADEPILAIVEGRHPVLDQTLPPGTFVPNGVTMGPDEGFFLLVTGPNMGGKSVYLRQTALLALMAQMGSFVPARSAKIGLADRIFTRVGASDELSRAQSTFMVEMTEAANILNNATPRSLVILDEIGRGTSTYDGVSLAWGITEYLHDRIGCRTLFATHYHELAQLAERLPGLRNSNVLVHEGQDGITFLHKIAPGSADKSYGIHVAERAGVPAEVLARAREVLAELEAHHVNTPDRPGRIRRPRVVQRSLFANMEDPILQALRQFDPGKATPEEIVAVVRGWKRDLRC
ncbi:MAG TPA: DNA mismatch repair protein MutS [Gemmataceae bacterium]|nr:DNA mismatch repair protein MutS [Gemmataceae bacterium]